MSDRLRALRDDISHNTSPHSEHARAWLDALNTEIAEREAPPATREEAMVGPLKDLHGLRMHLFGFNGMGGYALPALTRVIDHLESLALGTLRSATAEELLSVALDIAPDGVVSERLAARIAGLMPALLEHEAVRKVVESAYTPWKGNTYAWWRDAYDGGDVQVTPTRPENDRWTWEISDSDGDTIAAGEAPTIAAAMRAADDALRSDGRILIGGIPDEVLALVPVATATPGEFTTAPCLDCGGTGEVVPRESRYGAPVRCSMCDGAGTLPVPRRRVSS